jgi:hypothetical protein
MAGVQCEQLSLLITSIVITSDMVDCMEGSFPPRYNFWLKKAYFSTGSRGCILEEDPILLTVAQTCGFYTNVTFHGIMWGEDFQKVYGI